MYFKLMQECMFENAKLLDRGQTSRIQVDWKGKITTLIVLDDKRMTIEQTQTRSGCRFILADSPTALLFTDPDKLHNQFRYISLSICDQLVLEVEIGKTMERIPHYTVHKRDVAGLEPVLVWMDRVINGAKPVVDKLPAGIYYVGDPCYLLSDKLYEKYCVDQKKGLIDVPEHKTQFWVHGTKYGDGLFTEEEGGDSIVVDSGQIAVIPSVLYTPQTYPPMLSGKAIKSGADLASVQTFTKEITVSYDNGVFHLSDGIKNVEIDTTC
jgi:hypothetical protein